MRFEELKICIVNGKMRLITESGNLIAHNNLQIKNETDNMATITLELYLGFHVNLSDKVINGKIETE